MSALLLSKIAVATATGGGVLMATDAYCFAVYAALVAILMGFVVPYAGFLGDAFSRAHRTLAVDLTRGAMGSSTGDPTAAS